MISSKDIAFVRGNVLLNQEVKCSKFLGGDRSQQVYAKVVGKFPHFALLKDSNGCKICMSWVDFIQQGLA